MKIIIATTGLLIILIAVLVNHIVSRRSMQKQIQQSVLILKDAIRSYLDMVPLLLLKSGYNSKHIHEKRVSWYNSWNDYAKHWPIWNELITDLQSRVKNIENDNVFLKKINSINDEIDEALHNYNSLAIKHNQKSKKLLYRLAELLDFRSKKNIYILLESGPTNSH